MRHSHALLLASVLLTVGSASSAAPITIRVTGWDGIGQVDRTIARFPEGYDLSSKYSYDSVFATIGGGRIGDRPAYSEDLKFELKVTFTYGEPSDSPSILIKGLVDRINADRPDVRADGANLRGVSAELIDFNPQTGIPGTLLARFLNPSAVNVYFGDDRRNNTFSSILAISSNDPPGPVPIPEPPALALVGLAVGGYVFRHRLGRRRQDLGVALRKSKLQRIH